MNDKTWIISLQVKVTTMNGWMPDDSDVQEFLDNGSLEIVKVTDIKEAK